MRTRPGTDFTPMHPALPDICGRCDRHRRYHDDGKCLGSDEAAELRRARRGLN